jgi:hypothetical protein
MMVVQGQHHLSTAAQTKRDMEKHLKEDMVVELSVRAERKDGKLAIRATAKKIGELPEGAKLFAAVVEDKTVTKPTGGENGGAELHESAVVRKLLEGKPLDQAEWQVEGIDGPKVRVVVFVQDPESRRVFEAAQTNP